MKKQRINEVIATSIETFTGRARVMTLSIAIATVACVVVMLVGAPGAPVREAEASHVNYSNISGKITRIPQDYSVPGAAVYLYRWNGSSWTSLGKKASTNQYGYYTIKSVRSGYYYYVAATKAYGDCRSEQKIFSGDSQILDLRNPASSRTVAHVRLNYIRTFYCPMPSPWW